MYTSRTVYDTGMGGQPNGSVFPGLLSLDIFQLTVTCFVIMLALDYMLICRVLKFTYALILLVRGKSALLFTRLHRYNQVRLKVTGTISSLLISAHFIIYSLRHAYISPNHIQLRYYTGK